MTLASVPILIVGQIPKVAQLKHRDVDEFTVTCLKVKLVCLWPFPGLNNCLLKPVPCSCDMLQPLIGILKLELPLAHHLAFFSLKSFKFCFTNLCLMQPVYGTLQVDFHDDIILHYYYIPYWFFPDNDSCVFVSLPTCKDFESGVACSYASVEENMLHCKKHGSNSQYLGESAHDNIFNFCRCFSQPPSPTFFNLHMWPMLAS